MTRLTPSGAQIRSRRIKLGLSQGALARALGTSQQNVDRIEKGIVKASRLTPAIIDALWRGDPHPVGSPNAKRNGMRPVGTLWSMSE
jgi:predicted transcriptional regulator